MTPILTGFVRFLNEVVKSGKKSTPYPKTHGSEQKKTIFFLEFLGQISPMNEFQCDDSTCISQSLMCDGKEDCLDGSDEALGLCGSCPANKFQCDDGRCIDPKLR